MRLCQLFKFLLQCFQMFYFVKDLACHVCTSPYSTPAVRQSPALRSCGLRAGAPPQIKAMTGGEGGDSGSPAGPCRTRMASAPSLLTRSVRSGCQLCTLGTRTLPVGMDREVVQ